MAGVELTSCPYVECRRELKGVNLDGGAWTTCEKFDGGRAPFTAVCELGFDGVVAKNPFKPLPPGPPGMARAESSLLPLPSACPVALGGESAVP